MKRNAETSDAENDETERFLPCQEAKVTIMSGIEPCFFQIFDRVINIIQISDRVIHITYQRHRRI